MQVICVEDYLLMAQRKSREVDKSFKPQGPVGILTRLHSRLHGPRYGSQSPWSSPADLWPFLHHLEFQ